MLILHFCLLATYAMEKNTVWALPRAGNEPFERQFLSVVGGSRQVGNRSECQQAAQCWFDIGNLGQRCNALYWATGTMYSCFDGQHIANRPECQLLLNQYPSLNDMLRCEKTYGDGLRTVDKELCQINKKYGQCLGDARLMSLDCERRDQSIVPEPDEAPTGSSQTKLTMRRLRQSVNIAEHTLNTIRKRRDVVPPVTLGGISGAPASPNEDALDPCARTVRERTQECNRLDRQFECSHAAAEWLLYEKCEQEYKREADNVVQRQETIMETLTKQYQQCHENAEAQLWQLIQKTALEGLPGPKTISAATPIRPR